MLRVNSRFKVRILDALGIPYLVLSGNGTNLLIFVRSGSAKHIDILVEHKVITDKKAPSLKAKIEQTNLLEDWSQLRETIAKYHLAEQTAEQPWKYNLCLCTCSMPYEHGYIEDKDGDRPFSSPITELCSGLIQVNALTTQDIIDSNTGIHLLKQIVEVGLPNNEDELEARYEALPIKEQQARERRMLDDNPGLELILLLAGTPPR